MRTRTVGMAVVALMAAATASCSGAAAINGTVPVDTSDEQLPRVADDPDRSSGGDSSPAVTSALTEAPDRATAVVPSPPRSGRGNLADDPYLPPRAVIPSAPQTPSAPPSSTRPLPPPTTPPSEEETSETTRPTMPTPQRPIPLLPPSIGGTTLPDLKIGIGLAEGDKTAGDTPAPTDTNPGPTPKPETTATERTGPTTETGADPKPSSAATTETAAD